MEQNRLVQVGAGSLAVIVLFVTLKSCKQDDVLEEPAVSVGGGEAVSLETLAGLGLEGDTEQDTVATLVAEVKNMRDSMELLRDENASLRKDNADLKDMEQTIGRRVEGKLDAATDVVQKQATREYDKLLKRLEATEVELRKVRTRRPDATASAQGPVEDVVWIAPLGASGATSGSGGSLLDSLDSARSNVRDRINTRGLPQSRANRQSRDEFLEPYYTIPRNATLVSSTAMTALVGRVPFGGQVTDPFSFKVIIGRDNLTAKGIELPEVAYAVASGKAVGDWTLGCVRGDLFSMTFVFNDGTIRTLPEAVDISQGNAANREVKIGEISDRFGNPCVGGQRISNASEYLSQRIGVVSAQAAAEAAAAAQTTQITSVGGGGAGIATIVDGSTGEFVLGRMAADGANEVAEWLDQRAQQQFDAVYVAPGASVAMHITEQLEIDYDPNGRRTNHAAYARGGFRELD